MIAQRCDETHLRNYCHRMRKINLTLTCNCGDSDRNGASVAKISTDDSAVCVHSPVWEHAEFKL